MAEGARRARDRHALALVRLALALPASIWLAAQLVTSEYELQPLLLQWVLLLVVFELIAFEDWGGPGLSVPFAVQVAIAMLYEPVVAATLAFVGTFEPRELRRHLSPLAVWWRRCLALAVVAAGSTVFHAMAGGIDDRLGRVVPAWAVTVTLMYVAFLAAETGDRRLRTGRPVRDLLNHMDRVSPYRFPMTFPGMGWFSLPAAYLYLSHGLWSVLIVLGLAAYARYVCIKAWTLKRQLEQRNALLREQARRLEVHLQREQRTVVELEELNRMKSQFVAIASHEVRTPLTAIIGYASTLRRLPAQVDPDKRNEFLDIIERQAKRLLALVERLLTASKLESGKLTPVFTRVSVMELCREVVEGLGGGAARVCVELPAGLPDVLTDRRFLSQVLGNLLDNALKYSPRERPCVLGARQDAERLDLWVQDQGIGIPEAEQRRIFERFYQVDRSDTRPVSGVGLGLTLVRELVDALGGSIAVRSQPGLGSRFTVTLPLRVPHAEALQGEGHHRNGGNGGPAGARRPAVPHSPDVQQRSSNL